MKRVLIFAGKQPHAQSILTGWKNALISCGYETLLHYCNSEKPLYDVFDDFKPNIVVAYSNELTRAAVKLLKEFEDIKKIIFLSNWQDATDIEKEYIKELAPYCGIMFSRNFPAIIEHSHSEWLKMGVHTFSCLPAADFTRYKPTEEAINYNCDISLIGIYDEQKTPVYNKFLYPLLDKYKVKVFGHGYWPIANHLGIINDNKVFSKVVGNSKINLCITNELGYSPSEKIYKIMACKGLAFINSTSKELLEQFNEGNGLLFTENTFIEQINDILETGDYYNQIRNYSHEWVKTQTYHHRIQNVFNIIGIKNEEIGNRIKEFRS